MVPTQFSDLEWASLITAEKHAGYKYPGLRPNSSRILPKGHVRWPGYGAFTCETVFDEDIPVKMRDGVTLYTDIFRPGDGRVPAIILWSPYGKGACENGPQNYNRMGPYRMGISYQRLSGYETFEGLNPAEWVARGYAIVDIDARGCQKSEGDIHFWGQQEAEDVYDTIDFLSKQPWCSGNVVMAGNSWLAISQINFASRFTHPALKAIAPWEAMSDLYYDQAGRGGRPPNSAFMKGIVAGFAGEGKVEDAPSMIFKRPLYDEYWESKAIHTDKIDIPIYLTASYSSGLHCRGSFDTFSRVATMAKWLRVHASQEWHDIYRPEVNDELQKFFDRYAKNLANGWEKTPPLRLSLIAYHESIAKAVVERPFSDTSFPIASTKHHKLYFDANSGSLATQQPTREGSASYEGHSTTAEARFDYYFDCYTELSGIPWVRLCMSCDSHPEMDVIVMIRKISSSGALLRYANYPVPVPVQDLPDINVCTYLGQYGVLRASHRVSQLPKADPNHPPQYSHRSSEPIVPGKRVTLDIPIWPTGMVFEGGEGIAVLVSGHDFAFNDFAPPPKEPIDENKGIHSIFTGPEVESFLMVPTIN